MVATLYLGQNPEYMIAAVSGTVPMSPEMAMLCLQMFIGTITFFLLGWLIIYFLRSAFYKKKVDEELAQVYKDEDENNNIKHWELKSQDLGLDREILFHISLKDGSDEEGSDEEGSDEEGSDEEGSDEEGSDDDDDMDSLDLVTISIIDNAGHEIILYPSPGL